MKPAKQRMRSGGGKKKPMRVKFSAAELRGVLDKPAGEHILVWMRAEFSAAELRKKWSEQPALASPALDMEAYLGRVCRFVDATDSYSGGQFFRLNVYHCGDVTVILEYRQPVESLSSEGEGNAAMELTVILASDGPASGLARRLRRRLRRRFPYLKPVRPPERQ